MPPLRPSLLLPAQRPLHNPPYEHPHRRTPPLRRLSPPNLPSHLPLQARHRPVALRMAIRAKDIHMPLMGPGLLRKLRHLAGLRRAHVRHPSIADQTATRLNGEKDQTIDRHVPGCLVRTNPIQSTHNSQKRPNS